MSSDRTPEDVIAGGITRPMRDLSLDLYGEECDDAISEIANAALKALRDAGYTLVKDATEERDYPRGARVVGPWVRITEGDNASG